MGIIYYVRHGQTDQNKNKILTGRTDISINRVGKEQAEQSAKQLKNVKINVLFCSPLTRAKQTAGIINQFHELNIVEDKRIIERDYGNFTGKSTSEINREISWNWYKCDDFYPLIESPKSIYERVNSFIEMLKKNYQDKTVLVVAHSGVGRLFNVYFNGLPSDGNLLKLSIDNAEITKFEF